MKDLKELAMCNCKDNKYHNLPGWHEDFCKFRKWSENLDAAQPRVQPTLLTPLPETVVTKQNILAALEAIKKSQSG